jgi:hypothetical protein
VARLNRNPTTGAIRQPAGNAGCVGSGTCADGHGLGGAQSVAVSPDGKSVCVASTDSNAVARLNQAPWAALGSNQGHAWLGVSPSARPRADRARAASFGPSAQRINPDSYSGNRLAQTDCGDGRGWFRTSDLSRVKRRGLGVCQEPEPALPSGMRHPRGPCPPSADYRGLRTILGDSGREGDFLPIAGCPNPIPQHVGGKALGANLLPSSRRLPDLGCDQLSQVRAGSPEGTEEEQAWRGRRPGGRGTGGGVQEARFWASPCSPRTHRGRGGGRLRCGLPPVL